MDQNTGLPARPVYVLGAGFSKAINSLMPVTDDLGQQIKSRLAGVVDVRLRRWQSFEEWLTLQVTPMPFLQGFENSRRASDGERVIAAIADVLDDYVARATAAVPPLWLLQLIALWHQERAVILTFNYDTLVERAVNAAPPVAYRGNTASPILGDHVTYPAPAAPPAQIMGDTGAPHVHDSMQLLHLHGSLAWYWSSSDKTGATLIRVREKAQLGGSSLYSKDDDFSATHTLDRYLIPPITSKEGYYGSYLSISLWREAKEMIEGASSLAVLGYSLPLEDRAASQLFTQVPRHLRVDVADYNPGSIETGAGIVGHLATLGMSSKVVSAGGSALQLYVAGKLDKAVRSVWRSPVLEGLDSTTLGAVVGLSAVSPEGQSEDLYVLVGDERGQYTARRFESSWIWDARSPKPLLDRITDAISTASPRSLDLLTADKLRAKVDGGQPFVFSEGPGGKQRVVIGVDKVQVGAWDMLMLSTAPIS